MLETDQNSLCATVRKISTGAMTAVDAVERAIETIQTREGGIHAWVRVDRDGARHAARILDAGPNRGLLHGIPIGVKDMIDVTGMPTECGSRLRHGAIATKDAWIVERLRAAGAIVLGKTVTTEFAYFSPGPTRNPHDGDRTPGGSSSGSAAAVAAGMVPLALGTQTAASLTRPASFCGVAGYVTPTGRYPARGIVGLSATLDAVGLVADSVADLNLARAALDGAAVAPQPPVGVRPRILFWEGSDVDAVDAEMSARCAGAVATLSAAGAKLCDLELQLTPGELAVAHGVIMAYESVRERIVEARNPTMLSVPLAELFRVGGATSEADYREALSAAARGRSRVLGLLEENHAILAPAALGAAPRAELGTGAPSLSRPWQAMGLPVVVIPGLRSQAGLPLGLQLIGHPDRLDALFGLAHWIESRLVRHR